MNLTHPWRGALLLLALFLALTSVVSAPLILADRVGLPPELLAGSPFSSYLIPGLALLFGVGVPATVATVALVRHHALALPASFVAGVAITIFEVVEIAVVGWSWLQGVYLGVGLLLIALAAWGWVVERGDPSAPSHQAKTG